MGDSLTSEPAAPEEPTRAETIAANPVRELAIYQHLPALRSREFRLFWFAQMLSMTGTWVQSVAQQWLVLKLTGSAFSLGLVTTVQFTPLLLLALIGGAVSDRVDKRALLLWTQVISVLLAAGLGFLVASGQVQYWHVLVFAGVLGLVNAFYTPARQAFVPQLVERDALMNAVALNSAVFNASRVLGPAIGGILVAALGLAQNFFINAVSFIPVIIALLIIQPRPARQRIQDTNILSEVADGLRFIRRSPSVYTILSLVGVSSLFALNFTTVLPLFARFILHSGSAGFGFLTASMGTGSLIGAIILAFLNRRDLTRAFIFTGIFTLLVTEIAFGFSRIYLVSCAMLVIIGLSQTFFSTTANTRVLSQTPDALQGRVMSVYSLMFLGMTPFGSFLSGLVAERFGAPVVVIGGSLITLAFTLFVFIYRPERRRSPGAQAAAVPPSAPAD